jgi:hypothetical protein
VRATTRISGWWLFFVAQTALGEAFMTQQWTYLLLMKSELHAEMRVFQLVSNQQVSMVAFSGRRSGALLSMTFIVEADQKIAKRLEALLYRLQPILRVACFPPERAPASEQDYGQFREGAD